MKDYSIYTNEELVTMIRSGEEAAYGQLFENLRPVTIHEAEKYIGKMDTYGMDDFLQEGMITAWKIIQKNHYNPATARFSTYFGVAIRRQLIRIFTNYNLKNFMCIGEVEDYHGTVIRTLVESDYAKRQREMARERNRRYMARKKRREAVAAV